MFKRIEDLPFRDRVVVHCGNEIVMAERIKRNDPFQFGTFVQLSRGAVIDMIEYAIDDTAERNAPIVS